MNLMEQMGLEIWWVGRSYCLPAHKCFLYSPRVNGVDHIRPFVFTGGGNCRQNWIYIHSGFATTKAPTVIYLFIFLSPLIDFLCYILCNICVLVCWDFIRDILVCELVLITQSHSCAYAIWSSNRDLKFIAYSLKNS